MTVILGLSVGTRQTGIAVIRDGSLVLWKSKTFVGMKSKQKVKMILKILQREIVTHRVTHLAVKQVLRLEPLISDHVLDEVLHFANQRGIQSSVYYPGDMRGIVKGKECVFKKDMLEFTIHLYPCLSPLLEKEKQNLNPYYGRLFEAVLVAHLGSKEAS